MTVTLGRHKGWNLCEFKTHPINRPSLKQIDFTWYLLNKQENGFVWFIGEWMNLSVFFVQLRICDHRVFVTNDNNHSLILILAVDIFSYNWITLWWRLQLKRKRESKERSKNTGYQQQVFNLKNNNSFYIRFNFNFCLITYLGDSWAERAQPL